MRAMILAAGLGTRLRPLTDQVPKPLVEVNGRPLIEYSLHLLRSVGIEDIVINLHHLGEQVPARIGDGSSYGLRIVYSIEETILDTGGGIKKAEPLLHGEPFVVINGDTIVDAPLRELIETHERRQAVATMLLRSDPDAARYGIVRADAASRVRSILERPAMPPRADWRPYMFAGLHIFDPRVFTLMPPDRPFSITRETYPLLIERGETVLGLARVRAWLTVDTPQALAAAERALTSGKVRLSYLPEG